MPSPLLILTRPIEAALPIAARFEARCDVLVSPVITIENVETVPPSLTDQDLILTSRNAARWLAGRTLDLPKTAYCVGRQTAEFALQMGITARSADGSADDLVALIVTERPEKPLLHLRGEHSRGNIVERLRSEGLRAEEHVVYRQIATPMDPEALNALRSDRPTILPLYSPRSAALVAGAVGQTRATIVVAISAATAREAEPIEAARVILAGSPDAKAMEQAMGMALADAALG